MGSQAMFRGLLVSILVTSVPLLGWAQARRGGSDGGGGKGFVCRNADGSVQSVELLDLWEQRVIRGQEPVRLTGSVSDNLNAVLERMKFVITEQEFQRPDGSIFRLEDQVREELASVAEGLLGLTNFSNIERFRGVHLTETDDSFEDMRPSAPNCRIEQIVRYIRGSGDPHWQLNMDLFDKMDQTNQIGLAVHEAVYALLDIRTNESNSLRVRRAVGRVMSGGSFASIQSRLTTPYIKCTSNAIPVEFGNINGLDPLARLMIQAVSGGVMYFVRDPHVEAPTVMPIIERIGQARLIDFKGAGTVSIGLRMDGTIPEFFQQLNARNASFGLRMSGRRDEIEHRTRLEADFRSGVGTLRLTEVTGGGVLPPPVRNLRCQLVH